MEIAMRAKQRHVRVAAVLAATFLAPLFAGCESGADLLTTQVDGPSFNRGKGSKSPPAAFTVSAAGAMQADAQPLQLIEESGARLALEANFTYAVELRFDATRAAGEAWLNGGRVDGACRLDVSKNFTISDARIRAALDKLSTPDDGPAHWFHVVVGKGDLLGQPAPQHSIGAILYGGGYDRRLGGQSVAPATATVVAGDIDGPSAAVRYAGGEIFVKDRTERPHFHVICWNRDEVLLTIVRGS
jgi:hypothetical protein